MSKPTCRALLDWIAMVHAKRCVCEESSPCDVRRLASRVERVLALHEEVGKTSKKYPSFCRECEMTWPCPTVRLLNGEEL